MLTALVFALFTNALPSSPSPTPTESPDCLRFYHSACSEAIGKWLPEMSKWYGFEFFDFKAKRIQSTDGFIYEGRRPKWGAEPYEGWLALLPSDGTFFVYGNAGPPKGYLVYDYARQIAFYEQGCCAWREVVAAKGVSPPPKRVVSRNLSSLHTVRGVALGQSIQTVLRLYGPAPITTARRYPTIQRLAYMHGFDKSCGQWQTFIFKNNRLIYIALVNGC